MIKTAALIVIIALRLAYQPTSAQSGFAPFSSQPAIHSGITAEVSLLSFKGMMSKDKVTLEWIVSENESADQFEVERSSDEGIHFKTAAFVFGTDLPETGRYTFTEKAASRKIMYRVKLIGKNKQIVYSPIITIQPGA
ncbi:MAG: hypothetical protein ACO25B_03630 [Chitinophagaceae bacterium]